MTLHIGFQLVYFFSKHHNKWEKEKEENHNLIGYVFRPCKPEVVLHDDKNHEKPDKD